MTPGAVIPDFRVNPPSYITRRPSCVTPGLTRGPEDGLIRYSLCTDAESFTASYARSPTARSMIPKP